MKLTITGHPLGRTAPSVIERTDGELFGYAEAGAAFRAEAQRQDGRRLGPIPGAETTTAEGHLSAPRSFVHLCSYVPTDLDVAGLLPSRSHPDLVNAPVAKGEQS